MKGVGFYRFFCAALLTLSGMAQGAVFTFGNLTTDDTTDIITDTVSGRQYLRFDTFNLTYADTQTAVATGGVYEGWSIADSVISDDFIEGLFGGATPCSGADLYGTTCGQLSGWTDGALGSSFDADVDIYAFLSTNDTPDRDEWDIGEVDIHANGTVIAWDDWSTIAVLDLFGQPGGSFSDKPVNLLLYKDINPIPVPAAVWLFGTALIGLVGFSKRRKKA